MEIQSTTSAVIDAAREYVAKGWGVVPLKAGSKVPSIPELQPYLSRHATREELTTWRVDGRFGGVGVVTGGVSGLVVLDADGKAGEAELQRRGHPPTPTASTPRGAHLFFRCPGGELPTKIRLARGLDLKADGGYVAAPPGPGREWIISPDECEPAELPAWVFEELRVRGRRAGADDLGADIPNGSRNDTLASRAGIMRRAGMDAGEISAALKAINAKRCKPPLTEGEVETIAASIARYEQNDRFTFTFTPNGSVNGESSAALKSEAFVDMALPPARRYLVEGLIPEHAVSLIYGDGGVAKSLLALSLALAVSSGEETWLAHGVMGGAALYLDFELDAAEQHRRVRRLVRAGGGSTPPPGLRYMSALRVGAKDAFVAALAECKAHGTTLLIVDSLGPALEGDAELARDVIAFHKRFMEPFRAAGVTVLVIDHQSKLQGGERYQSKRAFGSVFKSNLARSVIQVEATERGENTLAVRLRQNKHNFGALAKPFSAMLTFTEEAVNVEHRELEGADLAGEETLNARERVGLALLTLGAATPSEIAEQTPGLSLGTVRKELSTMKRRGLAGDTAETRDSARVVKLTDDGAARFTVYQPYRGEGKGKSSDDPDAPEAAAAWAGAY